MSGTVRVRIPVAVARNGDYAADAWSRKGDAGNARSLASAITHLLCDPQSRIVWIEADVPLPVTTTVEGEVKS